ncbi:MAG: excinuclease ABC subunit UvrC [Chitinophagales bacterium]|nr:excinuclease ABC subunit UvrC [Chitinophagales bacterium]
MTTEDFKNLFPHLPDDPGVYRFIDENNVMIYVGKAKNLKKRVTSYFVKNHAQYKTSVMVRNAKRIEFTIVATEQDALLLENTLIKNYQPRYNINLKDDKTYPFICIKKENFPRVFLTRHIERDGSEYFGPYTSVARVSSILDFIRKMYPLRTCNLQLSEKNITAKKFKVCLEFHIGNCKGPCEGRQTMQSYDHSIAQIRHILKGNLGEVIQNLKKDMQDHADHYRFEEAETLRKQLLSLQDYQSKSLVVHPTITNVDVFSFKEDEKNAYVNCMRIVNGSVIQTRTLEINKKIEEQKEEILVFVIHELRNQLQSNSKEIIVPFKLDFPEKDIMVTVPSRGDKKKLLELSEKNLAYYLLAKMKESIDNKRESPAIRILSQLQKDFRLTELPVHIECFDNSNFQGAYPVASMVVFRNGKPAKKDYRHYNIKTVTGPNDFASMEEIVFRRYKRLQDEKQSLPQLIMIDGGKGQLNAAMNSLEKLGLTGSVAIAGIAKRLEEIYFPGDPLPLYVDKKSPSLRLIQQLRDEAHRFAITFHRRKRDNATLQSSLLHIKGISDKTAEKLLRHFHSVEKIKSASSEELNAVIGKHRSALIQAHFQHRNTAESSSQQEQEQN